MVDAGVEGVCFFADEGASAVVAVFAHGVEGDDEDFAEVADVVADPAGGFKGHVAAVDEIGTDGADDGAVGTDERVGGAKVVLAQDTHGVGVAAASGDDDFDAGFFSGAEGGEVAGAYAGVGTEERSIHVNCDQAGRRHLFQIS
jgi:hypothetical protein